MVLESPAPGFDASSSADLDHLDPVLVEKYQGYKARTEIVRLNSRRASTRAGYSYWVRRYEQWMYDEGRIAAEVNGVEFRLWPPQPALLEAFQTDVANTSDDGADHDWAPLAPGTVTNIVSALKWKTGTLDLEWESTPSLDHFLKGLRRILATRTSVNQATPLLVEDLEVIGNYLLAPTRESVRDTLAVVLFSAGLGLTVTGRTTLQEARDLTSAFGLEPALRTWIEQGLEELPFRDLAPHDPLIGFGQAVGPQQVRQILNRVARKAGLTGWKTSNGLDSAKALRLLEGIAARPDPARLRDHAMLAVGFSLALRRSELCNALVSWVAIERGSLIYEIHNSKTNHSNTPERMPVVTATNLATGPARALERWIDFLKAAGRAEAQMPLFPAIDRHGNLSDGPIGGDDVAEMIRKRVHEAGVAGSEDEAAGYAGHSLRRGFITSAVRRGIPLPELAKHTRHKNLDVLQVYYDHQNSLDPTKNPAARILRRT